MGNFYKTYWSETHQSLQRMMAVGGMAGMLTDEQIEKLFSSLPAIEAQLEDEKDKEAYEHHLDFIYGLRELNKPENQATRDSIFRAGMDFLKS